jgi:hypothetical protein
MLTIKTDEAVCEVSRDTLQKKRKHDDSCPLWINVYWSIVLNWDTVWCSFEVGHYPLSELFLNSHIQEWRKKKNVGKYCVMDMWKNGFTYIFRVGIFHQLLSCSVRDQWSWI